MTCSDSADSSVERAREIIQVANSERTHPSDLAKRLLEGGIALQDAIEALQLEGFQTSTTEIKPVEAGMALRIGYPDAGGAIGWTYTPWRNIP